MNHMVLEGNQVPIPNSFYSRRARHTGGKEPHVPHWSQAPSLSALEDLGNSPTPTSWSDVPADFTLSQDQEDNQGVLSDQSPMISES